MILTFPGGLVSEAENGLKISDVFKNYLPSAYKTAIAARVDGKIAELSDVLTSDCSVAPITFSDEDGKNIYRHTCAHVLAMAVKHIYPTVKLALGPAIENGFYYDFEFKTPISREDFQKIEAEMRKIIKANLPITKKAVPKKEALAVMKSFDEDYKVQIIESMPKNERAVLYRQGDFTELCKGPHLVSTGKIKAFKLTGLAGAYWQGNENNKMLTRIYGTAFDKKSELDAYLARLEEAKKRDHNKLGRELGYFMTDAGIGQGLPILLPKGAKVMQILQRYVEDTEEKQGYRLTKTPYMAKPEFYKAGGYDGYCKDSFFSVKGAKGEDEAFFLRPMTCPFQYAIFNNGLKSYRDLPAKYAETSTLFRDEDSGEMHGLIRLRQFTISEGHIICAPSDVEIEFGKALSMAVDMLKAVGLEYDVTYRFARRGTASKDKYAGTDKQWAAAEKEMKRILDDFGVVYSETYGEAAFYGPKLDVQMKNVHGKEDTLVTIQLDMCLAERFDMSYVTESGEKARPYIIHRTSMGCYERMLAMLIEKYAGAMPVWLSPTQVRVLSLTDRTGVAAAEIAEKLTNMGFRAEADLRSEKLGYKIRSAGVEKIPYVLVIGDKEAERGTVSVRSRYDEVPKEMTFEDFATKLYYDVKNKVIREK